MTCEVAADGAGSGSAVRILARAYQVGRAEWSARMPPELNVIPPLPAQHQVTTLHHHQPLTNMVRHDALKT